MENEWLEQDDIAHKKVRKSLYTPFICTCIYNIMVLTAHIQEVDDTEDYFQGN